MANRKCLGIFWARKFRPVTAPIDDPADIVEAVNVVVHAEHSDVLRLPVANLDLVGRVDVEVFELALLDRQFNVLEEEVSRRQGGKLQIQPYRRVDHPMLCQAPPMAFRAMDVASRSIPAAFRTLAWAGLCSCGQSCSSPGPLFSELGWWFGWWWSCGSRHLE